MLKLLKNVLSVLIPLPPAELRKPGIISAKWINSDINLAKDLDYLLYKLMVAMAVIGIVVLFTMLVDIWTGLGILIDAPAFEGDKLLFSVIFKDTMKVPCLLVFFAFYLRIRLLTDFRNEKIPFWKRANYINWIATWSQRKWLWQSLIVFVAGLCVIFGSHIYVMRITMHYEMQDSFSFILMLVLTQLIGISVMPVGVMMYALSLEKALRFYPEFKSQLEQLSEEVSRRSK